MRALLLAAALTLPARSALAGGFTLTSSSFADGATMPMALVLRGHGCSGGDHSPALAWSGAPAGTKSFAITLFDPDGRAGAGWWHWTVFDIPPGVNGLRADAGAPGSPALPAGAVEGRTSFGFSHYGGPCPPPGDPPHHYRITLYALRVAKPPFDAHVSGPLLTQYLRSHTLATARIVGRYGRPK